MAGGGRRRRRRSARRPRKVETFVVSSAKKPSCCLCCYPDLSSSSSAAAQEESLPKDRMPEALDDDEAQERGRAFRSLSFQGVGSPGVGSPRRRAASAPAASLTPPVTPVTPRGAIFEYSTLQDETKEFEKKESSLLDVPLPVPMKKAQWPGYCAAKDKLHNPGVLGRLRALKEAFLFTVKRE